MAVMHFRRVGEARKRARLNGTYCGVRGPMAARWADVTCRRCLLYRRLDTKKNDVEELTPARSGSRLQTCSDIDSQLTHYIIARADLPRGLQAAQVAHAAGESAPPDLPHGTHVVVLESLPTDLAGLAHTLAREGIPHVPIIESDPPYEHQLVAIGVSPLVERKALKRFLSRLPLLGKEVRRVA